MPVLHHHGFSQCITNPVIFSACLFIHFSNFGNRYSGLLEWHGCFCIFVACFCLGCFVISSVGGIFVLDIGSFTSSLTLFRMQKQWLDQCRFS